MPYVCPTFPTFGVHLGYISLPKIGPKSYVWGTFGVHLGCASPPPYPPRKEAPPAGARGTSMKRVKRVQIENYLRGFGLAASVALRKKQKRKLNPSQDFADLSADHLRGWSAEQVKIIMERKVELSTRAEIERCDVIL